jgi:hypothetical protein
MKLYFVLKCYLLLQIDVAVTLFQNIKTRLLSSSTITLMFVSEDWGIAMDADKIFFSSIHLSSLSLPYRASYP